MSSGYSFQHNGFCGICEREVCFSAEQRWFRDFLLCPYCLSIPRERALMDVICRYYPNYRQLTIHESSPTGRGVSARLARDCAGYAFSHYFDQASVGAGHPLHGVRFENLEALSFADASLDLFITQDVMEHVLDPEIAFREIARVLRPGGAHIFTVPLVRKTEPTQVRARLNEDGAVEHLLEPEFHGNPVDPEGSLVVTDWGYDITSFIARTSGLPSHVIFIDDIDRGIRAEFIDVIVSLKY